MNKANIYLYVMSLDEANKISEKYCLNHFPIRYENCLKFKNESDKLRSIGAGALISKVLNIGESDIYTNEKGKLFSDKINSKFNISHSGNYIVLAIGDTDIGVDIEKCGRYNEVLAKKILTPDELEYITDNTDNKFTKLWTIKEAVSKALGLGISLAFNSFSVMPMVNENSLVINDTELFSKTYSIPNYQISVCTTQSILTVEIINFIWNEN